MRPALPGTLLATVPSRMSKIELPLQQVRIYFKFPDEQHTSGSKSAMLLVTCRVCIARKALCSLTYAANCCSRARRCSSASGELSARSVSGGTQLLKLPPLTVRTCIFAVISNQQTCVRRHEILGHHQAQEVVRQMQTCKQGWWPCRHSWPVSNATSFGYKERHRTRVALAPWHTTSCRSRGMDASAIASWQPALFSAATRASFNTSYAPAVGASAGPRTPGLVRQVPWTMALLPLQCNNLMPRQL